MMDEILIIEIMMDETLTTEIMMDEIQTVEIMMDEILKIEMMMDVIHMATKSESQTMISTVIWITWILGTTTESIVHRTK